MDRTEIRKLAQKIWDYNHMNQELENADCILVLGSHDARVAERGAELFLKGWAPLIAFSGGRGRLTGDLPGTEADTFAQVAIRMGVPEENILIENTSTNTGENILFTKKLLDARGIHPRKIIIVQKPYMERRAYATFKKMWPEVEVVVTSPLISFDEYPNESITEDDVINIAVGDLQRVKVYPSKGFQIPQEIPNDVWQAYEGLVHAGYTKQLLSDQ